MRRMDTEMRTRGPVGAPPGVIRTAIVEDQREIREGLAMLIDATAGYQCTRTFRTMEEALAGIGPETPDARIA